MLCPLTTVAERAAGKAVMLEFSEACDGVPRELVGGTGGGEDGATGGGGGGVTEADGDVSGRRRR